MRLIARGKIIYFHLCGLIVRDLKESQEEITLELIVD